MSMIVITLNHNDRISVMHNLEGEEPHVVFIDYRGKFTDSPEIIEKVSESEMSEWIANHRNEGFEDRNP
jgi:hypothetical protein